TAEVLQPDEQAAARDLEAGFDNDLLGERVADLNTRPFRFRFCIEGTRRQNADAADAVAPRLRSHQQRDVSGSFCARALDMCGLADPDTHHVDERIAAIARAELHLSADGRDPDRAPVLRDAGKHATEQAT